MKKNIMSFQQRLYLYILLLIALVFGSIAVAYSSYSHVREEEQATLYSFALQSATIQNMEDEMMWLESTVEFTIKRAMADPHEEHDKSLEFIGLLVKNNSLLLGVGYVTTSNGNDQQSTLDYVYEDSTKIIHYNKLSLKQYNYKNTEWYKSAVTKKSGKWTEPYVDRTGTHKMVTSYSLPIKDSLNNVRGVVVADVALTDIADGLNKLQPFENSYSFILSKEGTVIVHPKAEYLVNENIFSLAKRLKEDNYATIGRKMMAGEQGSFRCDLNGTDVLVCYAPLSDAGWSVASVCPYSTLKSEMGSLTITVLTILIVGIILLSLCLHILLIRMVRPIRQMTDAAYHIAQGNFDASLPELHTHDDFGRLHDAFAHMQQSLKTYIKDLQNATEAKEHINSELKVAHRIQMEILPTDFVLSQGYENIDINGYLAPARQVGGDFYDFQMKNGKIFFTIGDVSGKGIAASIVMAITCTMFRSLVSMHDSPCEIISILNEALSRNNQTDMFVTMFLGILDTATGEMTYCNAGHNAPFLFSSEEGCSTLPVHPKLPLGIFGTTKYVEEKYTMKKGQSLLLYTDGLTEAEDKEKNQMGTERVEQLLATLGGKTSYEVLSEIKYQLSMFTWGAEQSDDLTLFAIRYGGCRTLILDNKLQEIEKLPQLIKELGEEAQLTKQQMMSLRLALEEALVNVINYAYPERETGKINLKALYEPNESFLRFELTDSGKPFDPTRVKDADLTLGVEDRPVGGLGVFLIKKKMDKVTYKRENGMNRLIMIKSIEH